MDALDVAILREMGVQPYGVVPRPLATLKAAAVARQLGVTQERVADRLARLRGVGILLGYEIYPNYKHLNLDVACYYVRFRDDAEALRALEEAAHVDGVSSAFAFVGGEMNVSICGASQADLDRKVALLSRLAGGDAWRKLYDLPLPPIRRALDHVDWRILQALRGDAFRSHDEVGDALGVSAKTVTRRVDRMGEEGAFFAIPELEWAKAEGIVLSQLLLTASEGRLGGIPRRAREAFGDAFLSSDEPSPHLGVFETQVVVAARSMRAIGELGEKARGIEGVRDARALVLRDAREDYAWVDAAIADRVRATAPTTA